MTMLRIVILSSLVLGLACGDDEEEARRTAPGRAQSASGGERPEDDQGRCEGGADREISEYDTSGDDYADVRKVFLVHGTGRLARLVLICREADLNGDGTKDVVRYYNDEGRPSREESDRDFDGRMDEITFFERGRIVRVEQDSDANGVIDTKIFYEDGRPLRAERDKAGRSTASAWRPDYWEYYEEGRVVRAGTDLDGDGRVDRWDRDMIWHEQQEREEAARRAEEEAAEGDDEGTEGEDDDETDESGA
jgi:hypothetical protein